jgi:hypothetical protein
MDVTVGGVAMTVKLTLESTRGLCSIVTDTQQYAPGGVSPGIVIVPVSKVLLETLTSLTDRQGGDWTPQMSTIVEAPGKKPLPVIVTVTVESLVADVGEIEVIVWAKPVGFANPKTATASTTGALMRR